MSFERVCGVADVAPGSAVRIELDDLDVAVVRDGDDWYAVADECSHASIPLSEGDVEGCEIECWLHGSRFDLRTGKPSGPPMRRMMSLKNPCTTSRRASSSWMPRDCR